MNVKAGNEIRVDVDRVRVDRVRKEWTEAGRSIWLAGLGAMAQVEEEGRDLFRELVERGRKVEHGQFQAIDRTVARTSERVQGWTERMQEALEDTLEGVLHRAGLPSQQDLDRLSAQLDTLAKKVDRLHAV